MILFLLLQLAGTLVTVVDKISWTLPNVSEDYANSLMYKYYIGDSIMGTEVKGVKCVKIAPGDSKVKCSMLVPKLMRGTYRISITSTDPSTGIESDKAPYLITIVDKPPTPLEIQKENP